MNVLKFCLITAFTLLSYSGQTSANEDNVDTLSNFNVSKEDIFKSLENLKNMGKISEEDYLKAKKELSLMSDSQVSGLKETAIGMVKNDPDKAVELTTKGNKLDPEAVKKQINDLSKPKE